MSREIVWIRGLWGDGICPVSMIQEYEHTVAVQCSAVRVEVEGRLADDGSGSQSVHELSAYWFHANTESRHLDLVFRAIRCSNINTSSSGRRPTSSCKLAGAANGSSRHLAAASPLGDSGYQDTTPGHRS